MTSAQPHYSLTEDALTSLNSAMVSFRASAHRLAPSAGRIPPASSRLIGLSEADVLAQDTVLRFVATIEAFTDAISMQLLTAQTAGVSDVVDALVEQHELSAYMTWARRRDAFANVHRLKLDDFPSDAELRGCIDVRNAIAHGLGRLTSVQRASFRKVRARITPLGVRLVGLDLVIPETAIENCHEVAVDYATWLDESLARRH